MHYDYVQYNRRVFVTLLVIIVVALFTLEVSAATATAEIELTTRSILIVDRSGSMKDNEKVDERIEEVDASEYDAVYYFDSRDFTQNTEYIGMGDSPICEAIDKVAGHFTHITVITDGEQWPEVYDALGAYSDLDIKILLTEEQDTEAKKFLAELLDHLTKSTLKVVYVDGTEEILLGDYQPPRYVVEIEIPDPQPIAETVGEMAGDDPIEEISGDVVGDDEEPLAETIDETAGDDDENRCLWWLALLLAVLIAALFDFIHELLTCGRGGYIGITKGLKSGGNALLDISGSMHSYQADVLKAAKRGKAKNIIAFAEGINLVGLKDVSGLNLGKTTHGWEALEMATSQGWDKVVLISDLDFNGKPFESATFQQNFKKITAVVPKGYCSETVQQLKKIADEVEVLYL